METTKLYTDFKNEFLTHGISTVQDQSTLIYMLPGAISGRDIRELIENSSANDFYQEYLTSSVFQFFEASQLTYSNLSVSVSANHPETISNLDYDYVILLALSGETVTGISYHKLTNSIKESAAYQIPTDFEIFTLNNETVDAVDIDETLLDDIFSIGKSKFFGTLFDISGSILIDQYSKSGTLLDSSVESYITSDTAYIEYSLGKLSLRKFDKGFLTNLIGTIDKSDFDFDTYDYKAKLISLDIEEVLSVNNAETLQREFDLISDELLLTFDGGFAFRIL